MSNTEESVDGSDKEAPVALEISFNAILGRPIASTMKLMGTLAGHEVLLLMDIGSTDNFVSDSLAQESS